MINYNLYVALESGCSFILIIDVLFVLTLKKLMISY